MGKIKNIGLKFTVWSYKTPALNFGLQTLNKKT